MRTATDRALRIRISLDAAAVAAARGRAGQPARHRGARVDTGWSHFVGGHEVEREECVVQEEGCCGQRAGVAVLQFV